ncbi:MAG: amidohydrolase family protein [Planctomycetes bacterium]|nr:amidohydrolase family protein [Planctomycetota bacterium]
MRPVAAQDLVVDGDSVYVVSGPAIPDGRVVIRDGKIAAVGPRASTPAPAGVPVRHAAVVTPGLIDAHATVGLSGLLNQTQDQDVLDTNAPIQPELRALDAYNARDPLVAWLRSFGVTTVHTGPAPGATISGTTLIVKTTGDSVEDAVLVPEAMVAATLGPDATAKGDGKSPGTRTKVVAVLRQALLDAQAYARKRADDDESKRPERDLRKETLARVLSGELPLLVTAQSHQDIQAALRVADEFSVRLVLDGCADLALVLDEIVAAGVPVIVHPAMMRTGTESDPTANARLDDAKRLADAGVLFAQQSGYEDYVPKTRVVLLEAGVSAGYGLDFSKCLASITLDAAKILGVDDRIGSLEVGKDGDVALYDGDPFEYTSHCVGTVIGGSVVSEVVR